MKENTAENIKTGEMIEVEIFKITEFGAFCNLKGNRRGLIHISQIADDFVEDVDDYLQIGDKVMARVMRVTADGKIDLTLKNTVQAAAQQPFNSTLEEKLKQFLTPGK